MSRGIREGLARKWLAATPAERSIVDMRQAGDYRDAALEWLAARVELLEARVAALEEGREASGQPAAEEEEVETTSRRAVMVRVDEIMAAVAADFGVSLEALAGEQRHKGLVQARHVACWLARRLREDLSLPMIGKFMGGRDHSTVLHGIRRVDKDAELRARAERIAVERGWMEEKEMA